MPSRTHTILIAVFAVLGFSGVVFGVYRLYSLVYGSFREQKSAVSVSDLQEQSQLQNIAAILSLQSQDTDGDGLSDYDEVYTYHTSPYLKDTDSDGIDDKTELMQGTDPLCPKNKDCTGGVITLPPATDFQNEVPPLPSNDQKQSLPSNPLLNPSSDIAPDQLRALLLQSGFAKEQLDAFSDEELLKTWKGVGGG